MTLHWLPVEQRVRYKILLMVFKAVHGLAPLYIQDLIKPYSPLRSLRSSSQHLLQVPHTSHTLVQTRAFSVAGPRLWNALPQDFRTVPSITVFKSKLKTYLFTQTYNT